jgi:hypothetical protein
MRKYGPLWAHLLHAQPCDIRAWSYLELIDRVDWTEEYLKARSDNGSAGKSTWMD